jgi:hypothetical protein
VTKDEFIWVEMDEIPVNEGVSHGAFLLSKTSSLYVVGILVETQVSKQMRVLCTIIPLGPAHPQGN